ncbi:hypothetical protein KR018_009394 [Drosophila ironensis]|nr:hypothetical protein KR018_009394 [Drosophila ironensis]
MDDLNPLAGTAHLLEEVDKKLMVLLRDGRTLIGYLRSVDQFANLVLQRTIERIHVGNEYGDIPRGVFIIRGENVVLLGEIVSVCRSESPTLGLPLEPSKQDREKEQKLPLKEISVDEILDAQRREQEQRQEKHRLVSKALKERGLAVNADIINEDFC